MAKESLDSDRVNYLIWRYLVESDYRETAVRLQKEWDMERPEQLAFAPHVTNHALVSILNRGLLYNQAEREVAQKLRGDVAGPVVAGFFGPLTPTALTSPAPPAILDAPDSDPARKHQLENPPSPAARNESLPPVKRPRLSNGYENGYATTPMDLDDDQHAEGQAYPSPEQLPSPAIVTNGPEQSTQLDKITELGPETLFLDLAPLAAAAPKTPILLQCEWNPFIPTILAAAGTDALARMWTLSRNPPDADEAAPTEPVQLPSQSLVEIGTAPATTATGLAWTSDGAAIIVASEPEEEGSARLDVWSTDGHRMVGFDGFDSPVICLRWNFSNTLCLALSPGPGGQGTLITVMCPTTRQAVRYPLPHHALVEQPLDVAWTGEGEFILGGGSLLQTFSFVDDTISEGRKYETRDGHVLSKIAFDFRSQMLATASDSGTIDIWDQTGQCRSFNAHQGLISALAWQPLQTPMGLTSSTEDRLLASAGEDGAISIWNARSLETKPLSSMTMGLGVVALAFTPDGAFIAGATSERILIWKVDDVNLPRASWVRGSELGWQTPQSHDSTPDEEQHCLGWDANGQRLAYGVNGMLAVINFRR